MNLFKKKAKLTTVSNLLKEDDVTSVLSEVAERKNEISDLLCIFRTNDGVIEWRGTPETRESMAIYLME